MYLLYLHILFVYSKPETFWISTGMFPQEFILSFPGLMNIKTIRLFCFHGKEVAKIYVQNCSSCDPHKPFRNNNGCARLASMGLPRVAHSGEPLTGANRTITLALSWWRHAPQVTPKWPTPQSGHWADPGEPCQSYSNAPSISNPMHEVEILHA